MQTQLGPPRENRVQYDVANIKASGGGKADKQ
jgi:hypothetical protein